MRFVVNSHNYIMYNYNNSLGINILAYKESS